MTFADGIVNVSAKDKATGKDQSMTIASSSGLSDKDIEKMVSDAEQYAETDKARRSLIEEANKADSVCADTEKGTRRCCWHGLALIHTFQAMTEFKDQLDAAEKEKVSKLVGELRELALKGQAADADVTADAIREKISETQQASLGLFQKVRDRFLDCKHDPESLLRFTRNATRKTKHRSNLPNQQRKRKKRRKIKFFLPHCSTDTLDYLCLLTHVIPTVASCLQPHASYRPIKSTSHPLQYHYLLM
jgi:molecular chaperone DnaK